MRHYRFVNTLKRRVHCLAVCCYHIEFQTTQFYMYISSSDVVSVRCKIFFSSWVFWVPNFLQITAKQNLGTFCLRSTQVNDIKERHTLAYKPNAHESPFTIFIVLIFKTLSVILVDYPKQNATFIVYSA